MSAKETATTSGTSFASLLTIAFIVLKLTHYINWPWIWVLSPLWLGLAFCVAVVLVLFVFGILIAVLQAIFSRK